jgi:hypothetical protein
MVIGQAMLDCDCFEGKTRNGSLCWFEAVDTSTVSLSRIGRPEGLKSQHRPAATLNGAMLSGIELAHRVRKGQFKFGPGRRRFWS